MHALLRTDDKPYLPEGERRAASLEKAITFDHVDFSYEPGEPVLHDVCIQIERGKTTALVGGSGAGKSTLVDLIPRLYDPDTGTIRYDGIDIREFTLASLRSRMAVVSQSTFIFNDTVRANIAYGRPDATEAEIRAAAEQANATGFIREMSDGFDTLLGDRGIRVSGGQRQRIAIARAILQDPEILILDEATSSLDSISEQLVQESLERLMAGRTVIAIAHRLSTIENADWVVVLEDGRVVEQGPYDALLQKREHLWSYHSIQFQTA
jgi:subfamily B ATP-binding cassette protein MsbA